MKIAIGKRRKNKRTLERGVEKKEEEYYVNKLQLFEEGRLCYGIRVETKNRSQ